MPYTEDTLVQQTTAEYLEKELGSITDEQETILKQRQIAWMRETRAAVVISEEQGEVDKFRKWDLDITPHRRLMKEGMDLPASMRDEPRFHNMQRMDIDEAFKEKEHPFRIAIVCAMWLTGFDVPSLSTLYLDKPLKALATFAGHGDEKSETDPARPEEELLGDLDEAIALVRGFLDKRAASQHHRKNRLRPQCPSRGL